MTDNRMEQPVNDNKIISLERKELMGVFLRFACFPMVTINYERFQTLQYFSALAPVLKKLYPNKEDQISAAKRHMAFYNTTPEWMGFTLGMNCAQEEQIANMPYGEERTALEESVNTIKASLMGPLAGIGDSLFQGTFRVIAAGVAAQLGLQGNVLAPFVFILLYNAPHFLARWYLMWKSYDFGSKFINKIYKSNIMDKLTLCFGILGLMVIGAMTMSMVSVSTPLVIQFGQMEPLALQSLFDEILPGLLPLCITWATAWLLKKQVNMLHIMIGMFILGIVCNVIGIL